MRSIKYILTLTAAIFLGAQAIKVLITYCCN